MTVSTTPTQASTPDAQVTALETLRARRADSLRRVFLDGRWVLQISSKADGTRDPLQIAQNGSHTFRYVDIVAEHDSLNARLAAHSIPSQTLLGSDFGRQQSADNTRIWVLLADPGGISSAEGGRLYCEYLFPGYSAQDLANQCLPRRLVPVS